MANGNQSTDPFDPEAVAEAERKLKKKLGKFGELDVGKKAISRGIRGAQQEAVAEGRAFKPFEVDPNISQRAKALGRAQIDVRQAEAAQAQAAQMDLAQREQIRGQQLGAIGGLQAAAAGEVPSAAAIQQQQGVEAALRAQIAAANTARGGPGAQIAAQQAAAQAGAGAQLGAIGQAGALRAQEQAEARAQLTGALGGLAAQDIGVAGTQAQLQQQTALANLGAQQQTSLANLQAGIERDRLQQQQQFRGLAGELSAQGQAAQAFQFPQQIQAQALAAQVAADAQAAAAEQARSDAILGGILGGGAGLLSSIGTAAPGSAFNPVSAPSAASPVPGAIGPGVIRQPGF